MKRRRGVAKGAPPGRRCRPGRRDRVLVRRGGRVVRYRGRVWQVIVLVLMLAATWTTALLSGNAAAAAGVTGLLTLTWLAYAVRVARAAPAGPGGGRGGPAPPGGAGVREPRRPLPVAPAGAAELPRGDDPPRRVAAVA